MPHKKVPQMCCFWAVHMRIGLSGGFYAVLHYISGFSGDFIWGRNGLDGESKPW